MARAGRSRVSRRERGRTRLRSRSPRDNQAIALTEQQFGIDLGCRLGGDLALQHQNVVQLTIEAANPGHLAPSMNIEQADDDANAVAGALECAVEHKIQIEALPCEPGGLRHRRQSPTVVPSTQEIQRNRDRAAVISSASPRDRASSRSPSRARAAERRVGCPGSRHEAQVSGRTDLHGQSCFRQALRRAKRSQAGICQGGGASVEASRAAARSPWTMCAGSAPAMRPHGRVNEQQSFGRSDRCTRSRIARPGRLSATERACRVRRWRSSSSHRSNAASSPVRSSSSVRWNSSKPFGLRNRRCRQHAGIDPEPIIQQPKMIAIRLQQHVGARPEGDPQVHAPIAEATRAPAPSRAGSRAMRSVGYAVPASVPPEPAQRARRGSCANAAERSARRRLRACIAPNKVRRRQGSSGGSSIVSCGGVCQDRDSHLARISRDIPAKYNP